MPEFMNQITHHEWTALSFICVREIARKILMEFTFLRKQLKSRAEILWTEGERTSLLIKLFLHYQLREITPEKAWNNNGAPSPASSR